MTVWQPKTVEELRHHLAEPYGQDNRVLLRTPYGDVPIGSVFVLRDGAVVLVPEGFDRTVEGT